MAHASDIRLLVLHGLRLKGFAEAPGVGAVVGVDAGDVERELAALLDDGLVLHRDGKLAGWALTAKGRVEQQRLVGADAAAAGVLEAVRSCYQRFLGLNGRLLAVCTEWQVRDDAPNDHADPAYDGAVLDRLREIHAGVEPLLAELAALLDRYAPYGPRFAAALARLEAGELEWFTKPLIDSYHTIWFELHEDLLSTLGIERSQEVAP